MKLSVEVPDAFLSAFKLAIDATILNLDCPDLTDDEAGVADFEKMGRYNPRK